jgi:hypothetical protein
VLVLKAPKKGKLEIVGSGFRYMADPQSSEPDHFTLVVLGKNRHDPGTSILDIAVESSKPNPAHKTMVSELRKDLAVSSYRSSDNFGASSLSARKRAVSSTVSRPSER